MKRGHGFTLLELLVAVAVFAVLSAVAYGGLRAVLDGEAQTRLRAEVLGEVQVTLAVLERDLRQAVTLAPRDRFGDRQAPLRFSPLTDEPELLLVRAGSGGTDRLRRVGWRVTDSGLERRLWEVVDGGDDREPLARVFLPTRENGDASARVRMELRFLGEGADPGEPQDSWPPLRGGTGGSPLPILVEVALDVPGLGRIERHIALTESLW